MRFLLVSSFALGALLGGVASSQAGTPPVGSHSIGGVNLNYYCQYYYGANYHSAVLSPGTAYNWACVPKVHHAGTVDHGISVQNACLLQYRLTGLTAVALNDNDPTSWRCFQGGSRPRPL